MATDFQDNKGTLLINLMAYGTSTYYWSVLWSNIGWAIQNKSLCFYLTFLHAHEQPQAAG